MHHNTESLEEVHSSVKIPNKVSFWRKLIAFIGPAYLISVGYMDPGNWATDIAGGSAFGYDLLWVLLLSNLIALLLQSLSARLGIVRGLDLAQASKKTYPKIVNIPLYVLAEIAIAACDLAEIIGMAIGLKLLFGWPLIYGIVLSVFDTLLILLLMKRGIKYLEIFIISMVFIIGVSFFINIFIAQPEWSEVSTGFIPESLSDSALYIAIGIIGATVMPHNLYLHSSLVQTRQIEKKPKTIKEALKFNFIDSAIALNIAFLVNASILILSATAFFKNGYHNIADIEDAHKLLSTILGDLAPTLFALALIASGQSSTITGTLAGQIVMEGYLNLRISPWIRRLITRIIAIAPALFTIWYFGEEKIGELLVFSQVVLSLQLGFAIIPLIHFCSDGEKMKGFAIKPIIKILAWISAIIIISLNSKLVYSEVMSWLENAGENTIYIYIFVFPVIIASIILLAYVTFAPMFKLSNDRRLINLHDITDASISEIKLISPYKKIAITVDFSVMDIQAISNAIAQGGKDANYVLIHIVESASAKYFGFSSYDYESRSDTYNLDKYVEDLQSKGFNAISKIGYGERNLEIIDIIRSEEIDLLVMGAHGHSKLSRIILGSTINSVRRHIEIPLLIIKPS